MTREMLLGLALKRNLDAGVLDWSKTQLPHGTQVVRLKLGSAARAGYLLALRRNPQARLHELGTEGDGNWAFEKPEPFALHLNEKAWLRSVFPAGAGVNQAEKSEGLRQITGTLDPVTPTILLMLPDEPGKLRLSAPADVQKLQRLEIAARPPEVA